jgi:hypothetical protein
MLALPRQGAGGQAAGGVGRAHVPPATRCWGRRIGLRLPRAALPGSGGISKLDAADAARTAAAPLLPPRRPASPGAAVPPRRCAPAAPRRRPQATAQPAAASAHAAPPLSC